MTSKSKERNVVGEHMREIAKRVAAEKIRRANAYARQLAKAHITMLFGGDDE
ncbi:hypothetical protein [Bradyrhizobium erythrophlei]|uniref:Uncharacterized protein n=1 Tax=Bradyrhizobium erythrophlei TaxID=1437360 RepID=A0A1M5NPV3_9BRAD|nr:hypothetical protein [Bradyrhizobium erythrophlei]SHG91528.1 hypothetical protein SAMN05443248_3073 [Bradyrhizobium erythrophlei]